MRGREGRSREGKYLIPTLHPQICGLGNKIRVEGSAPFHGGRDQRDTAREATSVQVSAAGEHVPGGGARGRKLHPDNEEGDAVAHRIGTLRAGGGTLPSVPGTVTVQGRLDGGDKKKRNIRTWGSLDE